ncbi:MAG: HAD-IC family P-type ATPase [Candidatus Aenigmatarchaeota archaeon]
MVGNNWHALSTDDVLKILNTTQNGLSEDEAKKRIERYGKNEILEYKKIVALHIFVEQFRSLFTYLLLFAAGIAAVFSHWLDFWMIIGIILLNVFVGFVQNYKAERAIQSLKKIMVPKAKVLRDGAMQIISSTDIVPGDIIIISEGDKIVADARLIKVRDLQTNEAVLTGESMPVDKITTQLEVDTSLPERKNMIFSGTSVVRGWAQAVVVATGMATEFGRISSFIQKIKRPLTPLQRKLNKFAMQIGLIVILLTLVFISLALVFGYNIFDIILTAISLAVAVVPEGLPAVITICLAMAVQRMYRVNSLVKRLSSAETLGRVNVICTDKTGTITSEEMTVTKIYAKKEIGMKNLKKHPQLDMLFKIACLCNNARVERINNEYVLFGDPTEKAILKAAIDYGFDKKRLTEQEPRLKEFSFTSARKIMSIIRKNKSITSYVKGAPDVVIKKCKWYLDGDKILLADEKKKKEFLKVYERFSNDGLRVIAFAFKRIAKTRVGKINENYAENELVFVGLMGMLDPPRPEVKSAIKMCHDAGIDVKMLTGDSELTARAIAREIGLVGEMITGYELDKMSDAELSARIKRTVIFARISPEHKLRIVRILREQGLVVAVTGDGINDAPALKSADIGVAMGIRGTDVARDVSDIVLMDDNFASIAKAVEEGRHVYDNIKKFTYFLLSSNIAELFFIFSILLIGAALSLPSTLALLPIQILWINFVTDGIIAIALGFEHAEQNIMGRGPEKGDIFTSRILALWLVLAFIITMGSIGIMMILKPESVVKMHTYAFTALVIFEGFNALNFRSFKQPLYKIRPNMWLYLAIISIFAFQFAIIQSGVLHQIFRTISMSYGEWLIIFGISSSILICGEIYKIIKKY